MNETHYEKCIRLQNAKPQTPEELVKVLGECLTTGYKYKFYDDHVKCIITHLTHQQRRIEDLREIFKMIEDDKTYKGNREWCKYVATEALTADDAAAKEQPK